MKKIILALSGLLLSFGAMAQPAPSSFPGCVYNSTPPSLSDKQTTALQCDSSGRVKTVSAGAGTITFPATVAGTVTSGGIPYFNSTTQMSSSAALAAGQVVIGGGAGAAPSTSGIGALATSLAIGGATIGTNALAVTGTSLLNNRLTITQATANQGILASTGYSLTGSNAQSMVDLAGTWNTSGTPTGIKLNITNTASNAASLLQDWQVGGSSRASVRVDGRITTVADVVAGQVYGTTLLQVNTSAGLFTINGDVVLARDAADTLAQRRTTNAQTFRVYGTTDASITNYDRVVITKVAGGAATIQTEAGGTGSAGSLVFGTAGTSRWSIGSAGNLTAGTDNTYDIGASGATRPRTIYVGTNITVGGAVFSTTYQMGPIGASNGVFAGSSDGVFKLTDSAGTSFARLQFGGTTSSFPALKRSTTTLEVKLADDSTYTQVAARGVIVAGAVPTLALAGGTCAGTVITGGSTAGLVTLTGACVATNTMTLSDMPAAPTGYVCDAVDRTLAGIGTTLIQQTSTSTTTAVFTFSGITTGATDVIAYKCMAY